MLYLLVICFLIGFPFWCIGYALHKRSRYIKLEKEYNRIVLQCSKMEKMNKEYIKYIDGIKIENNILNNKLKTLGNQLKISSIQKESAIVNKNLILNRYSEPHIHQDTTINNTLSVSDIVRMKDKFVCWEKDKDKYNLIIKESIINNIDYDITCTYVNKGWKYPEIIEDASVCCTIRVGDAYIQLRTPKKGIVYYTGKEKFHKGDIILTIDSNEQCIFDFEKQQIKNRLLEKKKKRNLEKMALQELIDEGELFSESNKRPPIPKDVADAVWNRDKGKCVYCGSTENLHFDHIIPFSKGGDTSIENLQLLCRKCNLEKSNKIG